MWFCKEKTGNYASPERWWLEWQVSAAKLVGGLNIDIILGVISVNILLSGKNFVMEKIVTITLMFGGNGKDFGSILKP